MRKRLIRTAIITTSILVLMAASCWACTSRDAGAPELVFAVFGDSRGPLSGPPVSPVFDEVLERVNETDASFCIHTGDFYVGAPGSEENSRWQANLFLESIERLEIPWYPVMGNHEADGLGWAVCQELVFEGKPTYYSFDVDNCHFVILDVYMPDAWTSLSPEQMAWLKDDLENTGKAHTFVFLHPPLYSVMEFSYSLVFNVGTEVRDQLAALLVQHEVDAVFCGHQHFYSTLRYQGLMQIITGGAGAPLGTPGGEEYLPYNLDEVSRYKALSTFHYVVVQVKGEEVSIVAYDLEGEVIDQLKIVNIFEIDEQELGIPISSMARY